MSIDVDEKYVKHLAEVVVNSCRIYKAGQEEILALTVKINTAATMTQVENYEDIAVRLKVIKEGKARISFLKKESEARLNVLKRRVAELATFLPVKVWLKINDDGICLYEISLICVLDKYPVEYCPLIYPWQDKMPRVDTEFISIHFLY